jgi:hypothetical protein
MNKKCPCCNEIKGLSEFYKNKKSNLGVTSHCKKCLCERSKKYANDHQEQKRKSDKEWRIINREHKARVERERYHKNPEKQIQNAKKWKASNPEKTKEIGRKKMAKYLATEKGKLSNYVAAIIRQAVHGGKANRNWNSLVDFTVDQLRIHLEKLFQSGWTWENYGTAWEIDHKMPISIFNYKTPDDLDFRLCWSLKNLQPLSVADNRKKQNKLMAL